MRGCKVAALLVLWAGPVGLAEEANVLVFRAGDIPKDGITVSAAGAYTVWAWTCGTEATQISIGGSTFAVPPPPGKPFAWLKLGSMELKAGAKLPVALPPHNAQVGYIALARGPCDLTRYFEITRVQPDPRSPIDDARLKTCRTLDDRMALRKFASKEEWERCREQLRQHILVSTGLWPLPERTPLHAKVFGTITRDDYTVSKVYFESRPGFYVCGNLYRPVGKKGRLPAVLNPHGHWADGRFGHTPDGCVRARLISFARQGYVAFSWDMVGYNDTSQVRHSFSDLPWGLTLMGLQLWNSIRATDWLASLDDVDPERISCTGESGGGTQTFMLCAVDDRIRVAAPVNMVSAIMQGGCECENAPLLRLEANNVEIASMMAPRPMLMVSATGDWTRNTLQLEYPAVREVYKLYDAEDKVHAVRFDAGHNYNLDSRNAVYEWFGRWVLGVADPATLREQPLTIDPKEDLLVFGKDTPRPANALTAESLRTCLVEEAKKQLSALRPKGKAGLAKFRETLGPAYEHTMNASQRSANVVSIGESERNGYAVQRATYDCPETGWRIPAIWFSPAKPAAKAVVDIVAHPDGKAGVVDPVTGKPLPLVQELLAKGHTVVGIDGFLTGEFLSPFENTTRPHAKTHDLTYNRSDLAWRVQDILTVIGTHAGKGEVNLIGVGRAGLWCLAARPLAKGVNRTVVDAVRFDADRDESWTPDLIVPGIRRTGGWQTAAALVAPGDLLIHNTGDEFKTDWVRDAYRAEGASRKLRIESKALSAKQIAGYLAK